MRLPELQRAFAEAVYADEEGVSAQVRPGRFPAARLLQIYRNNVFTSLTGALKAVYPVIERLVGEGFFAYAADRYIRRQPPTSGNLHDFGDRFADFLADFPAARELAYLPDVARLEWIRHVAFHAAEHAPLSLERLATVAPENYAALHLRLHPSVQLLASEYPVLRIWQVNQADYTGDTAVDLAEGGVRLLVERPGLDVDIRALSAGDDALLRAIAMDQPFGLASEAALMTQPDYDLATALRRHVECGTITDFFIPEEPLA